MIPQPPETVINQRLKGGRNWRLGGVQGTLPGEAALRLLLKSVASHLNISRFNTHPELPWAETQPCGPPGPATPPHPRSAQPGPSLLHDPFGRDARTRPAMAERYRVTLAGNMAAPAPAGAGEHGGDEEEGGSGVGRRCQPPVSSLSAFSYIPPRRESPAKLSYFHREAQEGFPLTILFLKDQRVTSKNFTDVTENTQRVMVFTLMMRKWQGLSLFCHLQSMGGA
nr:uncharacterized protein C5orf49 homolog isoform X2 [Anser cygnoides]